MTQHASSPLRAQRLRVLERQIDRLTRRITQLQRLSGRCAQIRLMTFIAGALLSAATFYFAGLWPGFPVLAIALIAFGYTVRLHRKIETGLLKHQLWRQIKSAHVARMNLDWENIPPASVGRSPAEHPFARDLDLTGERSIHRLLDTAVSQEGSLRLRNWLLETAPNLKQIHRRQAMAQSLLPLSNFRDKLTMFGLLSAAGAGGGWRGQRLLKWLDGRDKAQSLRPTLTVASFLIPLYLLLFILNLLGVIPRYWLIPFFLYLAILIPKWREISALFDDTLTLKNGLKRLEFVFQHLESWPLPQDEALQDLRRAFLDTKNRPSAKLKQVSFLTAAAGLTQNPFIGLVLNLMAPWNLYFAHRLNLYKDEVAHQLPQWLDALFELEALASLANFAYLNPDYAFPAISNEQLAISNEKAVGGQLFGAKSLGHPLIPAAEKVCNDFSADKLGQVVIITGSNMAGKSSFLRTVGVNLCLAYAGGPVNAQSCQTIPFRLFTALSVSDSVTDGISYFYAEVKRLKRLLDTLNADDPLPLMHLVDEIFRGTNNRERFIGSRAYIRALVGGNGFGLIATHDLELVKLADELPGVKNYHFREEVAAGKMIFDYKLRPGPCPTTNALKIMKAEGLPVLVNNEQ